MVAFGLLASAACQGAELILPANALERDQAVTAIYRTNPQATGKGELHLQWTDGFRRVVEDRTFAVDLSDETELRFPLDARRAVAMQNEVKVHFSFKGVNRKGEKDDREEDAVASFISTPPDRTWWDYMTIMWQDNTTAGVEKLLGMGVNAGKQSANSAVPPESLVRNGMRWYVENLATDFYATYHRFRADRIHDWDLLRSKQLYKNDPGGKEGFKRHPSFEDPEWRARIHDRAVKAARAQAPYRPIFYNLADETGIAELAMFWDFDFSDYSLDQMRRWLKDTYGSLEALNQQWESSFVRWEEVTPDTTADAMRRGNGNYSSWSDHKEWMDISFASALKMGADAVRSVDPQAYVGIEGAQMPGWGGYDYARLSATLQAMEPYDIGDNIEIIRSLNPQLAFLTTAFETGPWEKHRLWYELLHGARGHIVWDEKYEVVGKDGVVGSRGREVTPYWTELREGIGAFLIASERLSGPIAIHYSQASMRAEWMREQRSKGEDWTRRTSSTERKDSEFLRLRDSYCRLIEDQGLQYNFVSYGQVEEGELMKGGYRVMVLPRSSAFSAAESGAIIKFVRQGGTLIVDGEAGVFDQHCRRLAHSSLTELLNGDSGKGRVVRLEALNYHQQRVAGTESAMHDSMAKVLSDAGVKPEFRVTDARGRSVVGVETHHFRNGGITLIGLLSNPQLRVDELGPADFRSNQRFEKAQQVRLIAPGQLFAYDVRRGKNLGRVSELSLTVDPYEPTLIAFSATPLPRLRVWAPERVARGETAHIGLSFDGLSPLQTDVFHVWVVDPLGKPVPYYSGNVRGTGGGAEWALPFAQGDAPGKWTVIVKDALSGQQQTAAVEVY